MTDVRFYHLTRSRMEAVLPVMLEKTLERDQRAVVMAGSEERVEAINGHLWTWNDRGFLPHGSEKDGFAEGQPVWLTTRDENPNSAQVLFLTDGATTERVGEFCSLCPACGIEGGAGNLDRLLRLATKEQRATHLGGTLW